MTRRLVVDLETLGKSARARVVSIGASFVGGAPTFEAVLSTGEQRLREIDAPTLAFWMKQRGPAVEVVRSSLERAPCTLSFLCQFLWWLKRHGPVDEIWANGVTFDLPILRDLLEEHGLEPCWEYWNEFDIRTLRRLPACRDIPWPQMPHMAGADARLEAKWLGKALVALGMD